MNHWKIRYMAWKAKVFQALIYFVYRVKSLLGIKTIGYREYHGLILIKLLDRYRPPVYSMYVISVGRNLDLVDLESVHDQGIRLDKADYLSILINPNDRQVRIVTGEHLKASISEPMQTEIVKQMEKKVASGEILAGLELGMKKIKKCLSTPTLQKNTPYRKVK